MVLHKTFLIACGGTGGHLSPGIAVAQELTTRGYRCKLLISEKRVDQTLCGAYPELEFIALSGIGFTGKISNLPRCFWAAFKNIVQSFRLLYQTKADAVIGFGGFTNVGVVLAAKLLRKPCFLHEANRIPGRAVRILGRWATIVYVPEIFPDQPQLKQKPCGFPIRREFQKLDKTTAKQWLGFDPSRPLWVTVGGSQGARVLTRWTQEHIEDFKKHNFQLLCLTGMKNDAGSASESTLVSIAETSEKRGNSVCQTTAAVPSSNTFEAGNGSAEQKKTTTALFTLSSLIPKTDSGAAQKIQDGIGCLQEQRATDFPEPVSRSLNGIKKAESGVAVHAEAIFDAFPTVGNHSNACHLSTIRKQNAEASEPSSLPLNSEEIAEIVEFSKSMQRTVAPEAQFESTANNETAGNASRASVLKTEHVTAGKGTLSELADAPSSSVKPSRTDRHEESFIRFIPFHHQMHIVYSAADLVIGRAGAGTIAELTCCETPSILIPFPTSADDHQVANARAFEQQGGCVYLDQNDLSKLWEKAYKLLSDPQKLKAMSERLRELHHDDATQMMVSDIERASGWVGKGF